MLVSDLPFRRTRCKSQWMTDLIIPLHDGLGPLTTAWSCQSISFLLWCCPRGDSPAFPPGLSSPSQLWDWGLLWRLLLSTESKRDYMFTSRVWQKWWHIGHLVDIVSAWLGKHESGTSSLQSLVPSHIPCMVAVLCCQTEGPYPSGISDSLMEVAERKYLVNLKFSNPETRF